MDIIAICNFFTNYFTHINISASLDNISRTLNMLERLYSSALRNTRIRRPNSTKFGDIFNAKPLQKENEKEENTIGNELRPHSREMGDLWEVGKPAKDKNTQKQNAIKYLNNNGKILFFHYSPGKQMYRFGMVIQQASQQGNSAAGQYCYNWIDTDEIRIFEDAMPIRKVMKGVPVEHLAARGLWRHDHEALTACQRECTTRVSMTVQLEQEAYLSQHPEIFAMMELFIGVHARNMKRQVNICKEAKEFFLRPVEELDNDIRKRLGVGPDEPYVKVNKQAYDIHDDENLKNDLKAIVAKHYPPPPWSISTPSESLMITESSSFLSKVTSDTTLPTPEPVLTPEQTLSEQFMALISNTVDKAFYSQFDDQALRYDTAYVEISKRVEEAMEIPVTEIKIDIQELFENAFKFFSLDIKEKERIAAEIAWDKRMRKKMKKTLRRQANFKGHESPLPSDASMSSHESYRHAPPRPCACHPQWHYNRYDKDRFGVYMPREEKFGAGNATVTPVLSLTSMEGEEEQGEATDLDTKSSITAKSATDKSVTSKSSKASKPGKGGVKFTITKN